MMKIERLFQTLLLLLLLSCVQGVRAQGADNRSQPRYRMELIWIADKEGDAHEFVFVIGSTGFKTVKGLKDFVARLPSGSVLEWLPGCLRMGGEPLLSSVEEMEDFKRFCEEHGVEFILHPSG
jgi:hypothetical protein